MAQTGYTPILIYSSTTASQAPSASNLTNSTLGSELAINITDGKLFYKDNGGTVQVIGWKTVPTTAGGTGLTSYTAGDTLYYASGTVLSKLAIGSSKTIMTSSGSAPQWSASLDTTQGGTGVTSYTAGDLIYYASGTAFIKLGIGSAYQQLGVNAGGTAPAWQASATSVLTTQGDLLYASAANTLARLAKNTTASRYLSNGGTSNNPAWSQVDLTNGVTGTLPTGNGGIGQSSYTAGDLLYYASGTALSKLAIGANNTVLSSNGSAPQWATSLALGGSFSCASNALVGTTSSAGIAGNGLSVNSGAVGTNGTTCALALYGSGGDFYAQNWRDSSNNYFYDLVVFSSATDQMYRSYRTSGGTVTDCYRVGANGDFQVYGALSKGSGSFRIEHPHPELSPTHELVHSFIEGPQADLIYRGQVQLQNGKAEVNIDQAANMREGTFVLLCRDVQCFTSNETDWTNVRGKVNGNILTIEAQDPQATSTISWMVIGERQDKHMMDTDWTDDNGKVIVEPLKRAKPEIEA
jgi:hypothetical protein